MSALTCLRCPHRSPPPYTGVCLCLAEKDNPTDILVRAKSGKCPMKYFDGEPMPEPPPPQPVPRSQWPAWAWAISKLSAPEDVGVGATVKRIAGPMGEAFKAWAEALGIPCGCADREKEWNAMFPYLTGRTCRMK